MRDAFHQATVADEDERVVIDDVETGTIESRRKNFFGERHADGVGEALTQWAGCSFDRRKLACFGVARCLRMQLPKSLQLIDGQIVSTQMEQRRKQHRTTA